MGSQQAAAGAQQVGSQHSAAGAQQVGSLHSAGAQQLGSWPQPLLLSNRPNRPALALLEMVRTIIAADKKIPFIVSLLLTS